MILKIVAIKKMDLPTSKQADGEREFRVEIDILSRLDHPNLVTLIGYCADGKHRFVVYEFMPKGNLQDILNGNFSAAKNVYLIFQLYKTKKKNIRFLQVFRMKLFNCTKVEKKITYYQ